jgi:hypothetical protein
MIGHPVIRAKSHLLAGLESGMLISVLKPN